MTDLGWHVIHGETLLAALREAATGGSPDVVFAQLWANATRGADGAESPLEEGRILASERDDLIAQGVNPADLAIPLAGPDTARDGERNPVSAERGYDWEAVRYTAGLIEQRDAAEADAIEYRCERDVLSSELGEFKATIERLCNEAQVKKPWYNDVALVRTDDLRALLTPPDAGRDTG